MAATGAAAMSEQSDGAAAGRGWAQSADKLQVARLRSWFQWLCETDAWAPSTVYACFLTNKPETDNTGESGDDELFLAAEDANPEALEFFEHLSGWPGYESWDFVEGFVRGAVGQAVRL